MSTMTLTLTDFLLARIAEDEARAYEFHNQLDCDPSFTCVCGYPERIAAECGAKRQILAQAQVLDGPGPIREGSNLEGQSWAYGWTLRFLALPYAEHPDYREEWRP